MQQDMDDTNPSPGQDEKAESFGTGSFTTNTFNARLVGSHGMAILKYIQSEEFGKYGESIKLVASINVSYPPALTQTIRLIPIFVPLFTGIHE